MSPQILQFFESAHLPPDLSEIAAPFGQLAHQLVQTLAATDERAVALRKLLEAKDAAVRAGLIQHRDAVLAAIEPAEAASATGQSLDAGDPGLHAHTGRGVR